MKQPTIDDYDALLADITSLYAALEGAVPAISDQSRVETYWKMGHRIVSVVQKGQERGAYGQQVLKRLSDDLNERFGGGFSSRNVHYIRAFALQYPNADLRAGLTWTHYRALLSIEDSSLRQALETRVIDEDISSEQLVALVSEENRRQKGAAAFSFTPRTASPGIFRVIIDTNGEPLLDLGFGVMRQMPLKGVRAPEAGEYLKCNANGRFSRVTCAPGARYCYSGEVMQVIDGDTVKMRLMLGFDTFIVEKMRLRGVDAAEMDTEEGKKAHRVLARMLKDAPSVTVFTYSHDRYGRYIADLVVDKKYINRAMVESGAALFLKM